MSDGLSDALKGVNLISSYLDNSDITKDPNYKAPLKEGAKYDDGKPRMDLLPSDPLKEVAKVLTFGAKKYAAHNWRKGINYSRVYAGLQRHLSAWNDNDTTDQETGLNHLAHAACCLMFLLEYELNPTKYGKFDDRYKGE